MSKIKIIHSLENLGLSTNEAKVCLIIHPKHPLEGHELTKISGEPHPHLYEIFEKLVAKGLVISHTKEKSLLKFTSMEAYLDKKENENQKKIEFLRPIFTDDERPTQDQEIWNISGGDRMSKQLVQKFLSQGEHHVHILTFGQDMRFFERELAKTEIRIKLYKIYYGEKPALTDYLLHHQGQIGSTYREIAISSDSKQAVVGSVYPPESASSALTSNQDIIYILEQDIKHEMFLNEPFGKNRQSSLEK